MSNFSNKIIDKSIKSKNIIINNKTIEIEIEIEDKDEEDEDEDEEEDEEITAVIEINPKLILTKKEEDVKNMIGKLSNKIFDVVNINNKTYYLDKEFNLIWNEETELAGIISNKKYIFWDQFDKIIEDIQKDYIEVNNIIKNFNLNIK